MHQVILSVYICIKQLKQKKQIFKNNLKNTVMKTIPNNFQTQCKIAYKYASFLANDDFDIDDDNNDSLKSYINYYFNCYFNQIESFITWCNKNKQFATVENLREYIKKLSEGLTIEYRY